MKLANISLLLTDSLLANNVLVLLPLKEYEIVETSNVLVKKHEELEQKNEQLTVDRNSTYFNTDETPTWGVLEIFTIVNIRYCKKTTITFFSIFRIVFEILSLCK